jgi:GNAT superfamily N-acetyltransferase
MSNFTVTPIGLNDISKIPMKCWDNRETQRKIIENQEILGMAAWDMNNISIGQLHFYDVSLPNWDESLFPEYAKNRLQDWPLGWPLLAAKEKHIALDGRIMGIACFHVGTLLGVSDPNPEYYRKGIGSALIQEAIKWANVKGYKGIIAHGGSSLIPQYNTIMGCMPWKVYQKLGFRIAAIEEDGEKPPWWIETWSDYVKDTVQASISKDSNYSEINARLMVLQL